jgi:universal stress protein E
MPSTNLFVIIDPTRNEQPALGRAATLAGENGGHIHAFCCVYESDFSQYTSRREAKREIRERAQKKLDALVNPLTSDKVSVATEVYWNEHWFESAVHACARVGADLLLKSTFSHKWRSHILSKRSDYHILRHSPCPVLLSKTVSDRPYRQVLAALALEDNDRKHEVLNNHVVAQAQKLCRESGASLHAVAALEGTPDIARILKIIEDEDEEKRSGEQLISQRFGISAANVHIDYGPAKAVIIETAKKTSADLVVMGTIARSGIAGAVIGNTCEKVLDVLPIDILTVS